jgi:hypothetical protein
MTKILTTVKKIFAGATRARFIAVASVFTCLIAVATPASAAQFNEARVTQIVNDVKLLLGQAAPRPAVVSELVRSGTAVRTGTQSRSELTFADLTITRLGANTIFTFNQGTREMNLIDGAILFQVPKGSGGATIRTVGVTAAITGTTGIGEFHPATTSHPQLFSKWLCLEGTFSLYLPNGQSVELGPGKMVTTDGKSFSKVLTFAIDQVMKTSLLVIGYDTPLPSQVLGLIAFEEQNQLASALVATTTTNPLDPTRIVNVTSQAVVAEEAQAPPASSVSPPPPTPPPPTPPPPTPPPPTPSKFGTPSVISSPVPYLITNGTVITTDPSITTNGVTDYGKIYRGPTDDGAFSLWAFGSTSAVDTALDFDTHFNNAGLFPLAAFKFTSLVLAGNPTIDLTNGGVTNLALISVGDITSGLPGGTLTFTGLDALLLASQDGSINLGSEITFQDIPTLFFYARGTNGDLTLASPIIGTTDLFLYAGRNITFNAGTDLTLGGEFSARSAGGNISVSESGNITLGGSLSATTDVIANGANGGNITFTTGGFSSASNFDAETTVQHGIILNNGANITLNIGTDLTTNSGGALSLLIANNDGGQIGTGGNISLTTGGDLTAGSIDAFINNRNGGTIDSGGNLTFDIGGALTTQGDATFAVSNRNDGSGGGTIGSDVVLTLNAASISVGGNLFADVSTNTGGSDQSSTINITTSGNFMTQGYTDLEVENAGFVVGGTFLPGGTIRTNAVINLSASNISTANDYFSAGIFNDGGGQIGGSAMINVVASNAFNIGGDASFGIANSTNGSGTPAGTIGGNATINVSAANITANSLLAQIDNSNGGTIGGDAVINMNASGSATVASDATFQILGSDGAASAMINLNGGSYDVGETFLSYIDGNGTITFNNANLHADVLKAGVFGANGTLNISGGMLSADSILKLYAPGSNGQLNFMSNVTLGGNSMKILAADSVTIFDNVVVTIGGPNPADVYTNNANYTGFGGNGTTTGTFAGAGANNPQPLSNAPPFDSTKKTPRVGINVSSSDELLALLDDVQPGRGERIRMLDSRGGSRGRNASRFNAAAYLNAARRAMDRRTASTPAMRRLPQ